MLRVSAYYPYKSGARFDFDYYKTKHLELFREKFGPAGIERYSFEKGLHAGAPGSTPPYTAVFNVTFRDGPKFLELFAANAPAVMADIPKFTDIEPVMQFAEPVVEK